MPLPINAQIRVLEKHDMMSIFVLDVCKHLVRALSTADVIGTWLNASELFGEGKYQARHFERMILHIKTT